MLCILSACQACRRESRVTFQRCLEYSLSVIRGVPLPGFTYQGVCSLLPSAEHALQLTPECQRVPPEAQWAAASFMLGAEHREAVAFCHVDATSSWLSLQCFCALPAYPAPATMPFPDWWCSPRDSFLGAVGVGLGHCCCWPCPGLVSHCHTGCGLLAALLAPPIFLWFEKPHCAL